MISFDIKSLFTQTFPSRKIFHVGKIETNIPRKVKKELLLLCTKHIHVIFNGDIYIQLDGMTMGSPSLGSLLAKVFMCSLEESIVPTLKDSLVHWKRYDDDTHAYIQSHKIDYFMKKLNTYLKQTQLTIELKQDQRILFLDVSIRRLTNGKLVTTVFRKEANADVYMNCNFHAPIQWKTGTLANLALHKK